MPFVGVNMKSEKKLKPKIATMTFHMAHNYGAMLQAFALEKAISGLGYNCEVLDYRLPYIDNWSGVHTRKEFCTECGFIKGNLKYFYRLLKGYYRQIDKNSSRAKFNSFMRNDIKLSKKVYFDKNKLCTADYDAVVFGSDQIWNSKLTNGTAPEYFGKYFDNKKTKLIAYAASCGTDSFEPEIKELYQPLLKRFYSVAVREKGLADYITDEYGIEAQTVLDPVFLPEKAIWNDMAKSVCLPVEKPYLLIYAFETNDDIYAIARKIAEEKRLRLVTVSYQKREELKDMLQLTDCGPKDFVALIKNADFVCTTSFHGMAFSIIFEKSFYCMGHPLYSKRNSDLLELLGMRDRMFFAKEEIKELSDCDYSNAKEILKKNRQKSLDFLNCQLSQDFDF